MIWLAVLACFVISFVFSGSEAGLLSVNRVRLKHRLKHRDKAAIILNRLLEHPERLLVTVLLVTNLMNIFAMTLATQQFVAHFGNAGYLVALGIFLPFYLIGLELLPKSLFRRFPYRALASICGPLRLADLILSPFHFVGSRLSRLLVGDQKWGRGKLFVAREDFKYLTIESERQGTLGKDERQMIHNVVDFRAIKASDVMLPLANVQTISASAPISELIERSRHVNIDRWPLTNEAGEIVGLVNVLEVALDGKLRSLAESYQRRIVKVNSDEPAYSIVRKLRAARVTMAVALDSTGKQIGVVTWEDLIRRLVTVAVA
ncbi:MAG TPA: CNNM domain-containing protein [Chthoniobacter sp.]|nr:CNNM domain-containing protein [Chthoniobacter sp.]